MFCASVEVFQVTKGNFHRRLLAFQFCVNLQLKLSSNVVSRIRTIIQDDFIGSARPSGVLVSFSFTHHIFPQYLQNQKSCCVWDSSDNNVFILFVQLVTLVTFICIAKSLNSYCLRSKLKLAIRAHAARIRHRETNFVEQRAG